MSNDLLSPDFLVDLPGAPFTQDEVDNAVANVRSSARWHIAPQKTETVTLDVACGERRLRLPTRQLVSVAAIRNADTDVVFDPSTYRVSKSLARVVKKTGYWPSGLAAVEVDIVHGYTACPLDLIAVIAEAARLARREQGIRSVQIDDFQQQFGSAGTTALGTDETLVRYSLLGDPLNLGIA